MSKADKLLKRVEFYEKMASAQKPEAGDLLNKASLFERLALYSDSKSFLKALAQGADPNRNLIWKALQIMQEAGVDEATTQPLASALTFTSGNPDISAIKRAIQTAILTGKLSPLAHGPQINELRNISSQLKAPLTPEQEDDAMGGEKVNFPDDDPKDEIKARPPAPTLPPINRNDQQALLRFVTEEGAAFVDPSKMNDGLLGPETRKALEGVKNYFAKQFPQNPRMTDQQAITAAKTPRRQ